MPTPDTEDENVVEMPEPDAPGEDYVVFRIGGQAWRIRVSATAEEITDNRAEVLPIAARKGRRRTNSPDQA
jgi:hypothetical protein